MYVGTSLRRADGGVSQGSKKRKRPVIGDATSGGGPIKKKSRKKPGYITDWSSLFTSNVFVDAAENHIVGPEKLIYETNREKWLKGIVQGLSNNHDFRQQKNHINTCIKIIARGNIRIEGAADGKTWKLEGLRSTLPHYQAQGVAFMKQREIGKEGPWGGICADGMGLGKTVEAIALILCNPPKRTDKYRATLIVVEPNLLNQWKNELDLHLEDGVLDNRIFIHPGSRPDGDGFVLAMERADVVLTTYWEVVNSFPKVDLDRGFESVEELKEYWLKESKSKRGLLHKARFFRIILDESQNIKNQKSQRSLTCRALFGKRRWTLSGTPIMNRRFTWPAMRDVTHTFADLGEFYPYFTFLRVDGTGTYEDFTNTYCLLKDSTCRQRLIAVLSTLMFRRTHKDKILGQPILVLPKITTNVEYLRFSTVEDLIYQAVRRRFVRAINKAAEEDKEEKSRVVSLIMFLRLRQMVAHPFLIQEILRDMFEPEGVDVLEREALGRHSRDHEGKAMVNALKRLVASKVIPNDSSQDEDAAVPTPAPGRFSRRLERKIQRLKQEGKSDEANAQIFCCRCQNDADDPWVTSCLHVYCRDCLDALADDAAFEERDQSSCEACGEVFKGSEPCAGILCFMNANRIIEEQEKNKRRKKPKKVDMRYILDKKARTIVLSAKTRAVRELLRKWINNDPNKKIIVFSQWLMVYVIVSAIVECWLTTASMRIIETVCELEEWEYCSVRGLIALPKCC